jgi:uncharacterized coiled-coil protein SlyX
VVQRVDARGPQDESTLDKRVAALEAAVAEQKQINQDLHVRLEQTIVYLDKLQKSGQALQVDLIEVEDLGFTAGINYQSRELMLAAFRDYLGAQQDGLPAVVPPPAEEVEQGRVIRRRQ